MIRFMMKYAVLAAAALVLTAPLAKGQTTTMRFNVPFAFTTSGSSLPAGDYQVRIDPVFNRIVLETAAGEARFLAHATLDSFSKSPTGQGKLTFRVYGDSYFLVSMERPNGQRSIWAAPKALKQLAGTGTPKEVTVVSGQ